MFEIDAKSMGYKDLNALIRSSHNSGEVEILVKNTCGHRYIGDGISGTLKITIDGVPGNDMAAFMNGPEITVHGNAQDATGNTMNEGRIIIHGNAGDTLGYAMRGGEIYVRGDAGYRVGIHMKEYLDKRPVIIIGGKAGNFLGEYLAGGIMVVLGLLSEDSRPITGKYCGTGMHGGKIFIRGTAEDHLISKDVKVTSAQSADIEEIMPYLLNFSGYFGIDIGKIMEQGFSKLTPFNIRPYSNLYAY